MYSRRSASDGKKIIIGGGIFATIIACVCFGAFHTTEYQALVLKHEWKREIYIEQYQVVHESDTTWSPPADAYNVKEWEDSNFVTKTDFDGNPYTEWEDEDHYSYDVNRWRRVHTLVAHGYHKDDPAPHWPKYGRYHPTNRFFGTPPLGTYIEGGRKEIYTLHLKIEDKTKTFDKLNFSQWNKIQKEERLTAKVNHFGSVREIARNK